jgi:3-methyladenine DNA glycosylase/8-oxoguanine DNA glycosylase
VAFISTIGGRLISNPDTFEQLKVFVLSQGATVIEGAARESIARLWTRYGFAEKHRIVGVKL